jgi:hypothetical protein
MTPWSLILKQWSAVSNLLEATKNAVQISFPTCSFTMAADLSITLTGTGGSLDMSSGDTLDGGAGSG